MPIDSYLQRKRQKATKTTPEPTAANTPQLPVGPPPPQNYSPPTYDQQMAGQLSPGYQMPQMQGQYPQTSYPSLQQPGFSNNGFNPNMGLFGSFAPQGGMFSGLFGGQQ